MAARPSFTRILGRCCRRRCPVCEKGQIFASYLRLRRACPGCGWVIEREPGAVTGSMYLISIVTQLFAAALFFAFWILTDWAAWTKIAVAVPVIVLFALWALPFSKAVWVAVDYYTDVATGETARQDYERRGFEE